MDSCLHLFSAIGSICNYGEEQIAFALRRAGSKQHQRGMPNMSICEADVFQPELRVVAVL
jgi:hypothetical protein